MSRWFGGRGAIRSSAIQEPRPSGVPANSAVPARAPGRPQESPRQSGQRSFVLQFVNGKRSSYFSRGGRSIVESRKRRKEERPRAKQKGRNMLRPYKEDLNGFEDYQLTLRANWNWRAS